MKHLLLVFLLAFSQAQAAYLPIRLVTAGSGTADITLPTMTASDVTSRLTCVAPCGVYFDMQTTTATGVTYPFHELLYQWDFDDPVAGAAGTCTDGAPVAREAGQGSYCTGLVTGNATMDSKNYAEGPQAAHVFESPGTYTVTLTASQGDADADGTLESTEYKRATVDITVYDSEDATNGWLNTTACVANGATPVAGSNGCPTGATGLYNSSDLDAVLATALGAGYKRILFRRGDTFTASTVTTVTLAGPGMIGAYGTGAKPIFSGTSLIRFSASDWRVVDTQAVMGGATDNALAYGSLAPNITNLLFLRNDSTGGQHFQTSGSNLGAVSSGIWDGIFVHDSTVKGLYQAHGATGDNAIFASGFRVSLQGNHIDTDQWSEHGIRTYVQRAVIAHNTIEDIDSGRAFISMRAFDWVGGTGGIPANTYSGTAVVANNRIFGGVTTGTMGGGPTNQGIDGRTRAVIFERNYIVGSATTNEGIIMVAGQEYTLRNNILQAQTGISLSPVTGMNTGVGQCPDHMFIYNNSVYSSSSSLVTISSITQVPEECDAGDATHTTIRNNLAYAPSNSSDTMVSDPDANATITQSNNSTGTQKRTVNPFPGTPSNLSGFTPSNGAYTDGGGSSLAPVWNDLYGNWNESTRDIGAVVH